MMTPRKIYNFDFAWRFRQGVDPTERQAQCRVERGVDYGTGYIWFGNIGSAEECCNECANRDTCRAWSWNSFRCFAKDNATGKVMNPGRWSGLLGAPWPATASPPQVQRDFNDVTWAVVDAPHDMGRTREPRCDNSGRRQLGSSFLKPFKNNCSGWYRKHFNLPGEWRDGLTWIYFEGVHHYSIAWLNGERLGSRHINGYTAFWRRLDNSSARFGEGEANRNVLAINVEASPGAGEYGYHGGGLTRHQYLVHVPTRLFLPPDQVWVSSSFGANSTIAANSELLNLNKQIWALKSGTNRVG